ncbi:nuclear distribution protein RO10 [Sporothrix schenckii 1099-18]|uniref:Nuclear distribution protein RO10 n=1 Tax=Sporothrix schenckii 1099-18 TaxID=1397361 RepID=A0A0F2MAL1_SPOSC|nr:nuclear distribution protein RO10 [Sporothrix schenckii 1099-18]KJR86114.1 nuclear distribution protein RO10 [Sporothrix schenckii 1099-18]
MEQTNQATLELLESRVRRVEHLLYGDDGNTPKDADSLPAKPAVDTLADLERRFASLVSNVRVYAELLKICKPDPPTAHRTNDSAAPPADVPPTQLDRDALRAVVLSYASAFPATASALNAALVDTPVPEAALSAQLVGLVPRMEALAQSQKQLDAEVGGLRGRSERLVRQYYERQALGASNVIASVEARVERAEGQIRRLETAARKAEQESV